MLTPLETQLLAALKLRRATTWPFVPVERGGLGLTYEPEHVTTGAYLKRETAANDAVDLAIAAAEVQA